MTKSTPRKPRLATKLLVSGGTLLFGLIAAESAYRYRSYGPAAFSPADMRSFRTLGTSGMVRASDHPNLRYELRSDLREHFKFFPFETNSHGMRDREYSVSKPADTFRIAFVGDSYTMGSGVAIEDVFHSVLEESLNAEAQDNQRFECLNFGTGGYGLLDYKGTVQDRALAFSPDLIVIGLTFNDDQLPPESYLETPFEERPDAAPSFWRLTLLEAFAEEEDPVGEATRDEKTRFQRNSFEQIRALVPAEIPVFCIYLSTSHVDRERRISQRFERFASKVGIGYVDTSALFDGLNSGDYEILPIDRHPNRAGHAIHAEALERALREGDWLKRSD